MKKEVEAVIKEIKPVLKRDGGDIELISVKDGVVTVKLKGACGCCPHATQTLKYVVEEMLKERVPGVKSVKQSE